MKNFPRIFSLSTLGLIHHGDSDYLFHPRRTDFNGDSGTGKSLIADTLQLIFIGPGEYRSATDPSKRPAFGMVGKHTNMAYVFINVEIAENSFVVVGCYLEKLSETVSMFIGQRGHNWAGDDCLEPFDTPFLSSQLIFDSKILSDTQCFNKLREDDVINIKVFRTKNYHDLLFRNKLLPIDLSGNDQRLKNYARIIQSFSHGDILKDKSVKDFLFDDHKGKEIFAQYKEKCEDISKGLNDYKYNLSEIDKISNKSRYLTQLQEVQKNKSKAYEAWIDTNAIYTYLTLKEHRNQLKTLRSFETRETYKQMMIGRLRVYVDLTIFQRDLTKWDENRKALDIAQNRLTELVGQIDYHEENLKAQDKRKQIFVKKEDSVLKAHDWFIRYKEEKILREVYQLNLQMKRNRNDLEAWIVALKKKAYFEFFEEKFRRLIEKTPDISAFTNEQNHLQQEIERLRALQKFSDFRKPGSLAQWALDSDFGLTREQESTLIYFQRVGTDRPVKPSPGVRYIENIQDLMGNPRRYDEKDGDGFWLEFSGVREFIPLLREEDRMLSGADKSQVRAALEEFSGRLMREIDKKERDLQGLNTIISLLSQEGSQKILSLYIRRADIQGFDFDSSFPGHEDELMKIVDAGWGERYEIYIQERAECFSIMENLSELKVKAVEEKGRLSNEIENLSKLLYEPRKVLEERCEDTEKKLNKLKDQRDSPTYDKSIEAQVLRDLSNEEKLSFLLKDIVHIQANLIRLPSSDIQLLKSYLENLNGRSISEMSRFTKDIVLKENDSPNFETAWIRAEEAFKLLRQCDFELKNDRILSLEEMSKEVPKLKEDYVLQEATYNSSYDVIVDEFLLDSTEEYKEDRQFHNLVYALLPEVFANVKMVDSDFIEEISEYLRRINEHNLQISSRKINILLEVFQQVLDAFDEYIQIIDEIVSYFRGGTKQITGGKRVSLERTDAGVKIEWIKKLIQHIKKTDDDSFKKTFRKAGGMDELILEIYKSITAREAPSIERLFNPKNYFHVDFSIKRADGGSEPGSTGQIYTKTALLCIARLSLSAFGGRKQLQPGLRFMPIDEAGSLGTNYDMLNDLAAVEDYQIISLSIKQAGKTKKGDLYSYTLTNDNKEINQPAFAYFGKNNGHVGLTLNGLEEMTYD